MNKEKLTGYPSVDKPWLKYYGQERSEEITGKTVYSVLHQRNYNQCAGIALEYFGHKITYQELFQQIEATKAAFESEGVKKGDQVAFFTSSSPEIVYAIFALCRIGAVANMINPLFEPWQIVERIAETEAKIIVVMDQLYIKLCEALGSVNNVFTVKKIIVVPITASMPWGTRQIAQIKTGIKIPRNRKVVLWDSFIAETEQSPKCFLPDADYEHDKSFIMVYSSGSTGASKGIVLTNDGICATISHYLRTAFPYERGDRFLQMIPIWFSTGIVLSVLMPLCLGIAVILEPVFSKESFARDIAKYRPNMTLAATSLWLYAMRGKELKNKDLSFLKYPITGGEQVLNRVEVALNLFLNQHGCKAPLIKGYGMCELGSTISTDDSKHQKPGAAGFPISGVIVAAFDVEKNEEQPYNRPGELCVFSPAHMKEYFNNPEATKEFFWQDKDGRIWGRTGDMGYVDEDGFVHVLGRISDFFTAESGVKWFCFDIENIILENPNVAQCEVVGLSKNGFEVSVAHLVLEKDSKTDINDLLMTIHRACINKLDKECVPHGYRIWTEFPVKNNGKRDMEKIKEITDGFFAPLPNEFS